MGQKKDRNGQKRVHLRALHGHAKKPSDIETNISLVSSETYCCICIYIFGFGILWSGLSVKSFLALVAVQNGGGRSSSKNSIFKKNRGCHNAYFLNRLWKHSRVHPLYIILRTPAQSSAFSNLPTGRSQSICYGFRSKAREC